MDDFINIDKNICTLFINDNLLTVKLNSINFNQFILFNFSTNSKIIHPTIYNLENFILCRQLSSKYNLLFLLNDKAVIISLSENFESHKIIDVLSLPSKFMDFYEILFSKDIIFWSDLQNNENILMFKNIKSKYEELQNLSLCDNYNVTRICEIEQTLIILFSNSMINNLKYINIVQKLIFYKYDNNLKKYIDIKILNSKILKFTIINLITIRKNTKYLMAYINLHLKKDEYMDLAFIDMNSFEVNFIFEINFNKFIYNNLDLNTENKDDEISLYFSKNNGNEKEEREVKFKIIDNGNNFLLIRNKKVENEDNFQKLII